MSYNVESPRYSHLCGLTQKEIELVMLLADMAIDQARKDFKKTFQIARAQDCSVSDSGELTKHERQ